MKERFKKAELLGATRRILFEIGVWTEKLYDANASSRLVGDLAGTGPKSDADWKVTGSAGPIIEQSIVIEHLGRVIDCLNANAWHGDSTALNTTYRELTPIHGLLESSSVVMSAIDDAIDPDAASSVYQVLETFYVRVKLEQDHDDLELRELATIAGLAEKTVRMAAIGQDKSPDLVTFKDGSRTYVTAEEASRWLTTKNANYRPINWPADQPLRPVDPRGMDELGPYLRTLRDKANLSLTELGSRLGWDEKASDAYSAIENGTPTSDLSSLSLEVVMRLAQALCPSESGELVRIIDGVIHPRLLELRIAELMPNSTGN